MNELSQLTRQHYDKNETGNSLLSKVTTILDSLPDKPLESSQLAGLDQFHVMGLEARSLPSAWSARMSLTARLTGVGTPAACPSSTTAPLSQSTSSRLPRSRSWYIDEVKSAGRPSQK